MKKDTYYVLNLILIMLTAFFGIVVTIEPLTFPVLAGTLYCLWILNKKVGYERN